MTVSSLHIPLCLFLLTSACIPSGSDGQEDPLTPTPSLCPQNLAGPVLVSAPVPTSLSPYCIDSTEVTQSQYQLFLDDTQESGFMQGESCQWNESLQPNQGTESCSDGTWDPISKAELPVTCVDWCDAQAYCQWSGKRLCGRIGGGSYEAMGGAAWDASVSQWYNACSDGGRLLFPYGDVYKPENCNGIESELSGTWDVGSGDACKGLFTPLDDVFDMSGNVREWEDVCNPAVDGNTQLDVCYVRGGSYESSGYDIEGDAMPCLGLITGYSRRTDSYADVGFRCCVD